MNMDTDGGLSCLSLSATRLIESSLYCQFWYGVIGVLYPSSSFHQVMEGNQKNQTICCTFSRVKMRIPQMNCLKVCSEVMSCAISCGQTDISTVWEEKKQTWRLLTYFIETTALAQSSNAESSGKEIGMLGHLPKKFNLAQLLPHCNTWTFHQHKILPLLYINCIINCCAVFWCLTDFKTHASITQTGLPQMLLLSECRVTAVHLPFNISVLWNSRYWIPEQSRSMCFWILRQSEVNCKVLLMIL